MVEVVSSSLVFHAASGRGGQGRGDQVHSGSVSFSVQGEVHVGMKGMGWYELQFFVF